MQMFFCFSREGSRIISGGMEERAVPTGEPMSEFNSDEMGEDLLAGIAARAEPFSAKPMSE